MQTIDNNLKIKINIREMKGRFNYYWDWTDFSIGVSIAKPNRCAGWKWYLGLDIGFLSMWVYFIEIREQ